MTDPTFKKGEGRKYFHSNDPLTRIEDDLYNYTPYAHKVQQAVRHTGFSDEPVIFGLYGKWGEGKTSFLNILFQNLEMSPAKGAKTIIKYRFNPWRYSSEDRIMSEFFVGLINVIHNKYGLSKDDPLIKKLKEYAKTSLSALSFEVEVGFNLVYKHTVKSKYNFNDLINRKKNKKSIEDQKQEIDDLLKKYNHRIVIFIDDIDRLNKSEIYHVFRLVKLTASFKNITYILSFDEEMVARAIYKKYGITVEDGYKYIEKIINIPLKLPKVDKFKILEVLKSGIEPILSNNEINLSELVEPTDEHTYETGLLRFYFEIEGIEKFIDSPRELVRLLNTFAVDLIALKDEVNYSDLLWLELIKIKFPKLYDTIRINGHFFTLDKIGSLANQHKDAPYQEVITNFFNENNITKAREKEIIYGLVNTLFPFKYDLKELILPAKRTDIIRVKSDPKLAKIERRINHEDVFDIYFDYHAIGRISHTSISKFKQLLKENAPADIIEDYLEKLILNNDREKLRYELIDILKDYKKSENETKEVLAISLLKYLNKLADNGATSNLKNGNTRYSFLQEIFENLTTLNQDKVIKIVLKYSDQLDIEDILYVRKGLYHNKFKGTNIQKQLDALLIKKVKKSYGKKSFFDEYPEFVVRSILTIWKESDSSDLSTYLNDILNSFNFISFIKSFPTEWSGSRGKYLDDFGEKEFKSLKGYIDPKKIYMIISESNPSLITNSEGYDKSIWDMHEAKDDIVFLKQFIYWYNKNKA